MLELRIRRFEIDARGQDLVVQRQRRLDQAGDTGGDVEVADVRLDRADRAEAVLVGAAGAERLGQPGDLDRVAERGAGAVRLDVGDRRGIDAAEHLRHRDHLGLAVDARRGEADFRAAVVVERRALDDRVDRVAVLDGVAQPPEYHDARGRC